MNPRILCLLLAYFCVLCGQLPAAEAPKLNLLYITADDMNADSQPVELDWVELAAKGAKPQRWEFNAK